MKTPIELFGSKDVPARKLVSDTLRDLLVSARPGTHEHLLKTIQWASPYFGADLVLQEAAKARKEGKPYCYHTQTSKRCERCKALQPAGAPRRGSDLPGETDARACVAIIMHADWPPEAVAEFAGCSVRHLRRLVHYPRLVAAAKGVAKGRFKRGFRTRRRDGNSEVEGIDNAADE